MAYDCCGDPSALRPAHLSTVGPELRIIICYCIAGRSGHDSMHWELSDGIRGISGVFESGPSHLSSPPSLISQGTGELVSYTTEAYSSAESTNRVTALRRHQTD